MSGDYAGRMVAVQLRTHARSLEAAARLVEEGQPLQALRLLVFVASALVGPLRRDTAVLARLARSGWASIGEAAGMTRQGAMSQFGAWGRAAEHVAARLRARGQDPADVDVPRVVAALLGAARGAGSRDEVDVAVMAPSAEDFGRIVAERSDATKVAAWEDVPLL